MNVNFVGDPFPSKVGEFQCISPKPYTKNWPNRTLCLLSSQQFAYRDQSHQTIHRISTVNITYANQLQLIDCFLAQLKTDCDIVIGSEIWPSLWYWSCLWDYPNLWDRPYLSASWSLCWSSRLYICTHLWLHVFFLLFRLCRCRAAIFVAFPGDLFIVFLKSKSYLSGLHIVASRIFKQSELPLPIKIRPRMYVRRSIDQYYVRKSCILFAGRI